MYKMSKIKPKPTQISIARSHDHGMERRMKIKCDSCDKFEASVFCCADEAALCDACDRHVHHANMLATKHQRFSLLHPSSSSSPLCDICQERPALLFCQQDRAIFCRECDIPIHKANEHRKKHNRFLLTGVQLSVSSSSTSSKQQHPNLLDHSHYPPTIHKGFSMVERASPPSAAFDDNVSMSISSISEYLETLPGWKVDDFLDPSFSADANFQKTFDSISAMEDHQAVENQMISFPQDDEWSFWVPQMSPYNQPYGHDLPPKSSSSSICDGTAPIDIREADSWRSVGSKFGREDDVTLLRFL